MCFYWHNCIYISIWCVQCTSGFNGTDRTRVQKFQPISQLQDFTHPSLWLLYKDHQQRQQLKTTAAVFFGIWTRGIQLTLEGFSTVGQAPARKKQLFRRLSLGFFLHSLTKKRKAAHHIRWCMFHGASFLCPLSTSSLLLRWEKSRAAGAAMRFLLSVV